MAITADVYKGGILLGTGTINSGSNSMTSFVANGGAVVYSGRNVYIHSRAGSSAKGNPVNNVKNGSSWRTRVVTDGGATLTLADNCPH